MEKSFHTAEISEKSGDLALSLASMGVSFLLGCTRLLGAQSPLAIVWLAGMNGVQTIFALCGGIFGCVAGGGISVALPYIAAMAAVAAFRLIFGGFGGRAAELITAAFAGLCVLASGVIFSENIHGIFTSAVFAVLTFVCVPALFTAKRAASRSAAVTRPSELIGSGILAAVVIAALTSLSVQPFCLGVIAASAAVVHISDCRRGYSAAAGIICAAGLAVGSGELIAPGVILSVGGLILVPLERYSRLTRACALVFTVGAGVLMTGVDENSAAFLVSALTGALIRAFIPERLLPYRNVYSVRDTAGTGSFAPYAAFGKKLSGMSAAIGEMESAIKKTAQALDKRGDGDISGVYVNAADEVCRSCANNMDCWGTRYNRSADIMNKIIGSIRSGIPADEGMLTGHFADICPRRKELSQSLNKQYAIFCSARSASRRVGEMRKLLSAQLDATRRLLDRASEELSPDGTYDVKAAEAICALMREYGLNNPSALAVVIDGTLTIDAYAAGTPSGDTEAFADRLSLSLKKSFDPPMILTSGGQTHITISERSPLDAQIRIFSRGKSGGRVNGDCSDCFNDGRGSVYMILSDGMGSGSRARIDSAFACGMLSRLLKAGIDLSASLEMLNNSLMVKSSDESFATLDICRIDLFSGEVSLYKAGGAETFVRCGKKFARINGSGIPFGVSVPARYGESSFTLAEGDVVIMASDGAHLEQSWLEQLVMRETSLDSVLDTVGETLSLSAEKGKEDDITVIGVRITA